MAEMMRMYAPDMPSMPSEATLILNVASPIIEGLADGRFGDKEAQVAKQVYSLARLSHRALNAEEMKQFLAESYALLAGLL